MKKNSCMYSWSGPIQREDNKNVYYDMIKISFGDKQSYLIRRGEKVLVRSSEDLPFVAEIEEFYCCKSSQLMKFKAKWFYRPVDALNVLKASHSFVEHEIIYSNHVDINEIFNIIQPCKVFFLSPSLPIPKWKEHQADSFICRSYLQYKPKHPPQLLPLPDAKISYEIQSIYPTFPEESMKLLEQDKAFWNTYSRFMDSIKSVNVINSPIARASFQAINASHEKMPKRATPSPKKTATHLEEAQSIEISTPVVGDSKRRSTSPYSRRTHSESVNTPSPPTAATNSSNKTPSPHYFDNIEDSNESRNNKDQEDTLSSSMLTDDANKVNNDSDADQEESPPVVVKEKEKEKEENESILSLSDEILLSQLQFENNEKKKPDSLHASWLWYLDNHRTTHPIIITTTSAARKKSSEAKNILSDQYKFPIIDDRVLRQHNSLLALDEIEPYLFRVRDLRKLYKANKTVITAGQPSSETTTTAVTPLNVGIEVETTSSKFLSLFCVVLFDIY